MDATRSFLASMGLPRGDRFDLPTSGQRFPDGAQYRVEIPSVEGPAALEAVLEAADEHGVRVHRVSQGSGIMLQTDNEIRRMVAMGAEHGVEMVDPSYFRTDLRWRQLEQAMLRPVWQQAEDVAQVRPRLDVAQLAARKQ